MTQSLTEKLRDTSHKNDKWLRNQAADEIDRLTSLVNELPRFEQTVIAFAEENRRMAHDTILLDPVLNRSHSSGHITADFRRAESMMIEGCVHSSKYHAAIDILMLLDLMDYPKSEGHIL